MVGWEHPTSRLFHDHLHLDLIENLKLACRVLLAHLPLYLIAGSLELFPVEALQVDEVVVGPGGRLEGSNQCGLIEVALT